jgi:hypothetical protein
MNQIFIAQWTNLLKCKLFLNKKGKITIVFATVGADVSETGNTSPKEGNINGAQ